MRVELWPVRARGGEPGGFMNLTEVGDEDYSLKPRGGSKKGFPTAREELDLPAVEVPVGKQSRVGTTNPAAPN